MLEDIQLPFAGMGDAVITGFLIAIGIILLLVPIFLVIEAIFPTIKGKDHIDAYRTKNGQYYFVNDKGIDDGIKTPKDDVVSNFEAMNTMDRDFYANEWEEAEKYKKKSIWELATAAAPWFIIFLMFTMLIINWDSIAKPALDSQKEALKMQQENTKLIKEIQKTTAILNGVQIPEDMEPNENDPKK
jgi:hypothetical protein